jgi:hypothetical protein
VLLNDLAGDFGAANEVKLYSGKSILTWKGMSLLESVVKNAPM